MSGEQNTLSTTSATIAARTIARSPRRLEPIRQAASAGAAVAMVSRCVADPPAAVKQ
jgi:hypothetical protein